MNSHTLRPIGAVPNNSGAAAAGWDRVFISDPVTGNPEMSFIYHKLTGDLPTGFGSRMPLDRSKLSGALIEIIRLWIENGAPATGWVPGTDQ